MKNKEARLTRRRLRSSYATTVISISLVLFLLGLIGLLMLNAGQLASYVRENISLSLIIKDGTKEVDIIRLQKALDASSFVKSTEYISRELAARELQEELGEDFVEFLGYNPLLASIDVYLHGSYANPDSIARIESKLSKNDLVKEIFYQKSLVNVIHENVRKISIILLIFSALIFVMAMTLINNTIRLSVYAKRFLINTMQLVGATRSFIRKPFLLKSALHGVYASIIAMAMLSGGIYLLQKEIEELNSLLNYGSIAILYASILLLGLLITWISTYFAVNKYLRLKEEELYYI
jgi:cell division transport system permease protein